MFDEIKAAVSLPALLQHYGIEINNGMIACPFHDDAVPSCKIYPDNHFFCYGCQANGDVFDFVRLQERLLTSLDAARWLAKTFSIGVKIGQAGTPKRDVLSSALTYYRRAFWAHLGHIAPYIYNKRRLPVRLLDDAQVGWADGKLGEYLIDYGYKTRDIQAAGLMRADETDFFRNGFIFPIFVGPGEVGNLRFRTPTKKIYQLPKKHQGAGAFFFGQELFWQEKQPEVIYLAEGEFDALALRFWRLAALATCGTPVREALVWLTDHFKGEVRLVPDQKEGEGWLKRCREVYPLAKTVKYPAEFPDYDDYMSTSRHLITDNGRFVIRGSDEGKTRLAKQEFVDTEIVSQEIADLCVNIEAVGNHYVKVNITPSGVIVKKIISNFRLIVKELIHRGGLTVRQIQIRNAGDCIRELRGEHITNFGNLRSWLFSAGKYDFWGSMADFYEVLRYEEHQAGIIETTELEYSGHHKNPDCWLFQNYVFQDNLWHEKDGTGRYLISEKVAYRMIDSRVQPPRIIPPPTDWRAIEQKFTDMLFQNIGYNALLVLGWSRACFYVPEIVEKYSSFPILYLAGKTQAGKTVLARWLSKIWGLRQLEALAFRGTTWASLVDYLSNSSEVPVWISEFEREDDRAEILKSLFDRTGVSKKVREDGQWKPHFYPFRACAIIEGQRAPERIELINRLIVVILSERNRQDKLFEPIELMSEYFGQIGAGWLSMRAETKKHYSERLVFWRAELLKSFAKTHGSISRLAQNYGIVIAALEMMLPEKRLADFIDWVKGQAVEHEGIESRHSVVQEFIEDLQYLENTNPDKLKKMVRITSALTTLWLGGIIKLIEDTRRVRPEYTVESLCRYFRDEVYFHRVGGITFNRAESSHYCLVLKTDKLPPAMRDIATNYGIGLATDAETFGERDAETSEIPAQAETQETVFQ